MWTKQPQADVPSTSPAPWPTPSATPVSSNPTPRTNSPAAHNLACLGSSLEVKGKISGEEDLQIDGKVEGPVSLHGQRLTVGRTGVLNSEVIAREVVVYGKVIGNITTARISVEDGAYFKGRIEIERPGKPSETPELEGVGVPTGVDAN